MKPYGPLMVEHRLIERMVALMKSRLDILEAGQALQTRQLDEFIRSAVDFFRIYADKTHHGKEEDILFKELETKPLSDAHRETMNELIEQHRQAREGVKRLEEDMNAYVEGRVRTYDALTADLRFLTNLYPGHIDTEDNRFFRPVMKYFSQTEQEDMLDKFFEFDKGMIHARYEQLVSAYERKSK